MRFLIAMLGVVLLFGSATAKPITIDEAMKELRDRGMQSVDGVTILGESMVNAYHKKQGFRLKLTGCDSTDHACKVATFQACKEVAVLSRLQLLEVANAYNNQNDPRGSMYVDNKSVLGATACIKTRNVLDDEDKFSMADVFEWQLTIRDFLKYIDSEEASNSVRSIMGGSR
ncbi:MAG: hypothetical protein ABNH53_03515 [Henriciella sp.]|jgi:hypothetical protein